MLLLGASNRYNHDYLKGKIMHKIMKSYISEKTSIMCGFFVMFLQWFGAIAIFLQSDFDINLPLSYVLSDQIALGFLGFSRSVDEFWNKASAITIISMIAFIGMSFVTYVPGEKFYGPHSILVIISNTIMLYTIYKVSLNEDIIVSRVSTLSLLVGFLATIVVGGFAGRYNYINILAELLIIAVYHIWMISLIYARFQETENSLYSQQSSKNA